MRKVRTLSATWSIRRNVHKNKEFLLLESPRPQLGDYEWGLRINIDKFFLLQDIPEVDDFGSASSGLCFASSGLSNLDNPCGQCIVKTYTQQPNCMATPWFGIWDVYKYSERKPIYKKNMELLQDIYLKQYHVKYEPGYYEEV